MTTLVEMVIAFMRGKGQVRVDTMILIDLIMAIAVEGTVETEIVTEIEMKSENRIEIDTKGREMAGQEGLREKDREIAIVVTYKEGRIDTVEMIWAGTGTQTEVENEIIKETIDSRVRHSFITRHKETMREDVIAEVAAEMVLDKFAARTKHNGVKMPNAYHSLLLCASVSPSGV